VLVLAGGRDYWSNGIHLGMIEAAESPAEESWRNINAIDDLVRDIILTTDRWVVSALRGSAGAGGGFAALAADEVWAAAGCVLNPHYRDLGNLYGSEYWTYLLPRRIGAERAAQLVHRRLPMGAAEARRSDLLERVLPALDAAPLETIFSWAQELAQDRAFPARIAAKRCRRAADEAVKPLERYRAEELERMYRNFFGFDPSYHVARYNFIHQVPKSRTPLHLALHRAERRAARRAQRPAAGATEEEREHV
jgi:putative two-component system hydrogenase maturation factor HypX/HoxX